MNKQTLISLKKQFILLLALIINITFSYSQPNRTYVGFNIEPSLSTQLSQPKKAVELLALLPSFGINFQQEFYQRKIYFKSGFGYYKKGTAYKDEITNINGIKFGEIKIQNHYSYINLPLLLGFQTKKMYFELGPTIDYLYLHQIYTGIYVNNVILPTKRLQYSTYVSVGSKIEPKYMRKLLVKIGIYSSYSFQNKLLNIGLKFGVNYRLKKQITSSY